MKANEKPSVFTFLKKINHSLAVPVMATVVSICALAVSLYQTELARRQQLASVWPYLSIGGHGVANDSVQGWGIQVVNNGLGPAIVEEVEMRFSGHKESLPFEAFMDSLYAQNIRLDSIKGLNYTMNEIIKGTVISAGNTLDWFSFDHRFSQKLAGETVAERFFPKLQLVIRYKSLYNERWESCFNCIEEEQDLVRRID